MAIENANFAAILFVSVVTGIPSTAGDYTEYATQGLADMAHLRRGLDFALRCSSLEWYSDGMKLFAYKYNGHEWIKRSLTWAIEKESVFVNVGNAMSAADKAFKQWEKVTPFRFERVLARDKPDIRISFEDFNNTTRERKLCDIDFPGGIYLDDRGVTLLVNNAKRWTNKPCCCRRGEAYNLNFALLYLVSRALGLGHSKDRKAVMSRELQRFDLNADYDLDRDDIIGLQRLYGFPELQDGGRYISRFSPQRGSSSESSQSSSESPSSPSNRPLNVQPISWRRPPLSPPQ